MKYDYIYQSMKEDIRTNGQQIDELVGMQEIVDDAVRNLHEVEDIALVKLLERNGYTNVTEDNMCNINQQMKANGDFIKIDNHSIRIDDIIILEVMYLRNKYNSIKIDKIAIYMDMPKELANEIN